MPQIMIHFAVHYSSGFLSDLYDFLFSGEYHITEAGYKTRASRYQDRIHWTDRYVYILSARVTPPRKTRGYYQICF